MRKQRHAEDLKADDLLQHFNQLRRTAATDARNVQALSNAVAAQRQVRVERDCQCRAASLRCPWLLTRPGRRRSRLGSVALSSRGRGQTRPPAR